MSIRFKVNAGATAHSAVSDDTNSDTDVLLMRPRLTSKSMLSFHTFTRGEELCLGPPHRNTAVALGDTV